MRKFYKFPNELDTIIQENGSNLSGGDKQKIAISRIFLEDSNVLILDEIVSSIDKDTANDIIQNILEYNKNKIIFIISHDNSMENFCNKIINIENKEIKLNENQE
ncbi:MAG: ABC transporter ATP-binding protein [Clostridium butyricum]|nr:ABC transporter ATP-binding protein [Clostridium butyricum]